MFEETRRLESPTGASLAYHHEAAAASPCGVLLICHEPEFYQDVVGEVWDCSKWTTKIL